MCVTTPIRRNYGFKTKRRTPMFHDVVRARELAMRVVLPAI